MNQDWLDQYKGVEYLKNKKERDWKFIIGMIVLLAIFAVMGGAFWNMVGKQAQMVREEEQKEEANAISAIYIETGEFLKTGVFVDLNNGTIFSADIPAEGIYNKKGKLISDDVLENGDKVKIYGDGIMLESFPGQYPGVTKIQRTGRASLEETQEYEDQVTGMMKPVAVQEGLEETENEIRKTILDYFTDIRNGRGITCSDPASCTCKCVRTGDHADRTGNTHYQVGTGQRSS